jgi:hypothetical protein
MIHGRLESRQWCGFRGDWYSVKDFPAKNLGGIFQRFAMPLTNVSGQIQLPPTSKTDQSIRQ